MADSRDKERKIVGRIVGRMYKHSLESSGKLPDRKDVRKMEKKAAMAAQRAGQERK